MRAEIPGPARGDRHADRYRAAGSRGGANKPWRRDVQAGKGHGPAGPTNLGAHRSSTRSDRRLAARGDPAWEVHSGLVTWDPGPLSFAAAGKPAKARRTFGAGAGIPGLCELGHPAALGSSQIVVGRTDGWLNEKEKSLDGGRTGQDNGEPSSVPF